MIRNAIAAASLLALASCGGNLAPAFQPPSSTVISAPAATGAPSNIPVANRSVAAAEQTLTLAMNAARIYTDLPRCGTTLARICSDPVIAGLIRHHAIQAHNALVAARRNEASIELVSRMWTAIDALRAAVPAG